MTPLFTLIILCEDPVTHILSSVQGSIDVLRFPCYFWIYGYENPDFEEINF